MVKENQIPYTRSGAKILIDIDKLSIENLVEEKTIERNYIRRV